MTSYQIVNTVCTQLSETERAKKAAARALYAELLKYYELKETQKTA